MDEYTVENLDNFPNDIPFGTRILRFEGSLKNMDATVLVQVFTAIPASVTQLDLSWNNLGEKGGDGLAQIFAVIPTSVTQLDLNGNELGKISTDELVQVLSKIPATVTFMNLGHNAIFIEKTLEERDALIDKLQSINTHGRLSLENNGERTFIRAASLLISMKRNGIFNQKNIPLEIINEIAYWLGAPHKRFFTDNNLRKFTQRMQPTDSVSLVEPQDSKMSEPSVSFLGSPS